MLRDDSKATDPASFYTSDLESLMTQDQLVIGQATLHRATNQLDDVFGSAPGSPSRQNGGVDERPRANIEISDLPRLKEKHEKEGYRDGVTKGKAESAQAGFDEGSGLGAVIGLRIGEILGLIEGILGSIKRIGRSYETASVKGDATGEWAVEKKRLEKLWADAKVELKTENVFKSEWWGEDGIWRYQVPGEEEKGIEVVFDDVASAHPLLVKWEGIMQAELRRWDIDTDILNLVEEERDVGKPTKRGDVSVQADRGAPQDLAW